MDTLTAAVPAGYEQWPPMIQAGALFFLTFISEDATTIGAGLLAAADSLAWSVGYWGCFLGIWMGDAGLYALARGAGRPLLERRWARRFFQPAAVADSERWFARKGGFMLVSSRFVPGARLPTYLAAGFLRMPFGRFLLITGLAAAVWTLAIFGLAEVLGARLLEWAGEWTRSGWWLLAAVVVLLVTLRLVGGAMRPHWRPRLRARVDRWTRWEFWPPWLFYAPVVFWYAWLTLRHRGATLPSAANPGIVTGGLVGESKSATLDELARTSPDFTARAYPVAGGCAADRIAALRAVCEAHDITIPFVLKPDLGQRGNGVKIIRDFGQADEYLRHTDAPLVVQEYAPGPQEAGIFYYRFPDEPRGRIFAITEKVFPTLTGDGRCTVEELIWRDERARCLAGRYLERLAERRSEVLPAGTTLRLVESGNHAQGCIFRDGGRLNSAELEARIDDISRRLDGFFIGRYDVRYACEDELRAGRHFTIIELNGAASEATSIYDAGNSLLAAYRTLFRQWALVFAIGAANRARGFAPARLPLLLRHWRAYHRHAATYPVAD